MSLVHVLLVVLLVALLFGVGGHYGGLHSYGWRAPGGLGLVLLIIILILVFRGV